MASGRMIGWDVRCGLLLACLVLPLGLGLGGCESAPAPDEDVLRLRIDGRDFFLELALDNATRVKGLSERDFVAADGGMLFVFPTSDVRAFVMRDCFVPIDIIYLDGSGRIVAMHAMQVEPPRDPDAGEGQVGETNLKYETRLKKYSSRFDSQFVIELAGGTLEQLNISTGDLIALDLAGLERRAR